VTRRTDRRGNAVCACPAGRIAAVAGSRRRVAVVTGRAGRGARTIQQPERLFAARAHPLRRTDKAANHVAGSTAGAGRELADGTFGHYWGQSK